MILNITKESIRKLSGEDLARLINIASLSIENNETLLKVYNYELQNQKNRLIGIGGTPVQQMIRTQTYEWEEVLEAATEEYHDRFINGGDLEGYNEALIKEED